MLLPRGFISMSSNEIDNPVTDLKVEIEKNERLSYSFSSSSSCSCSNSIACSGRKRGVCWDAVALPNETAGSIRINNMN